MIKIWRYAKSTFGNSVRFSCWHFLSLMRPPPLVAGFFMRGRMGGMLRQFAYCVQVLRLTLLMLLGAAFGGGPDVSSHSMAEAVERQYHGAIIGAFLGLAVELAVRQILPVRDIQSMQMNLRNLLIASAYALFWTGLVFYATRK
jgi:hypothetical protein